MTVVPLRIQQQAPDLDSGSAELDRSMIGRISMILGAFRHGERHLGISEIARRTHLPKSSVSRIVSDLVEHRLLERDGRGVRFGLRMFELGEAVMQPHNLRRISLAGMADLRSTVNLTVHLAILEGADVVYLEILRTPQTPPLPSRVGGRMAAYATAVGKALLAWSPESVVEEALSVPLRQVGPRTITDTEELRRQLQQVRTEGVAFEREESRPGTACVAAAIMAPDGLPIAAISATGSVEAVTAERVAAAVRLAGLKLSSTIAKHPRLVS